VFYLYIYFYLLLRVLKRIEIYMKKQQNPTKLRFLAQNRPFLAIFCHFLLAFSTNFLALYFFKFSKNQFFKKMPKMDKKATKKATKKQQKLTQNRPLKLNIRPNFVEKLHNLIPNFDIFYISTAFKYAIFTSIFILTSS